MNSIAASAVVLFFASWTSNVMAGSHTASNSGVIHFYGSIVESPCTPEVHLRQLNMSCTRNGQNLTGKVALNSNKSQPLPNNIGNSHFHWVNEEKKMGILVVNYR